MASRPLGIFGLAGVLCLFGCRDIQPASASGAVTKGQLAESQLRSLLSNWNCVYEFKDHYYYGKYGSGSNGKLLGEQGRLDSFTFSHDKRNLAFWRLDASGKMPSGPDVHVHSLVLLDLASSSEKVVTTEKGTFDSPGEQLAFSPDGKLLAYGFGQKLQLVPLDGSWKYVYQGRWIDGYPEAVSFAPDGKHVAFSRDGDLFQGQDLRLDSMHLRMDDQVSKPFDATRIAPLADFFDTEGGSASTPTYTKQVYWLPGSNSLLAVVARHGGSGWRCVALLKRPKNEDAAYQGTGPVTYGWEAKWVTPREEMTFDTSVCPDGKHWTSRHADRLHLYDLQGTEVGSLPTIADSASGDIIAWLPK